jgi:type I restriction enzyme S subunit
MPQFKKYKLGDLCSKITDGAHFSPKECRDGLPMASVKDLTDSGITIPSCKRISESDFINLVRQGCSPDIGDVLIAKDGNSSLDTVCTYRQDEKIVLLSSIAILKPNKLIISDYLKYYLSNDETKRFLKENFRSGSAIPRVVLKDFKNVPLLIPDLLAQTRIASILSSLDDKIELNRRTNHTLEQIAQTLFNKYFVDDIDPENLPEGWRWGKLGDIYKTTSGGTPSRTKPEYYEGGNIGWVKSKELDGGFILDTEEKITKDALKNSSAKLLPVHSVLVAMYGATVGEIATLSIEATCNQAICAILPNEDYAYSFVLQFLKLNKEELINRASGSAQQNISQLVVQNFELAIPPSVLVKEFHKVGESLFLKIESNLKENKHLMQIRDSLLPKLMSGEIEVNVAEKELVN